jgi:hypothetical protein
MQDSQVLAPVLHGRLVHHPALEHKEMPSTFGLHETQSQCCQPLTKIKTNFWPDEAENSTGQNIVAIRKKIISGEKVAEHFVNNFIEMYFGYRIFT